MRLRSVVLAGALATAGCSSGEPPSSSPTETVGVGSPATVAAAQATASPEPPALTAVGSAVVSPGLVAVWFVEWRESLVELDRDEVEAAVLAVSTSSAGPALVAETLVGFDELARIAPAGATSRAAVLESRVSGSGDTSGVVEVWLVHVLSGGGAVRSIYSTATLTLEQAGDGRWLLDGVTFEPGPTPSPVREPDRPDDVEARLVGFSDPIDELVG